MNALENVRWNKHYSAINNQSVKFVVPLIDKLKRHAEGVVESLVTLIEENDLDGSSERNIPHMDAFANVGGGGIATATASRRQRCSFVVLDASVVLVGGGIAHSLAGDVSTLRQQGRGWIRERGVVHVQNSRLDPVSWNQTCRSKCVEFEKKKKLEIANNISPFKWAGNFKRTGEGRGIESVYERV